MFPTTLWSTIRQAAEHDGSALQRFAEKYRPAVFAFLRQRGLNESDADDVCQSVFVRLITGRVLSKAHPSKGRFRSLILAVTDHVVADRRRGRRESTGQELTELVPDSRQRDEDFDRAWVLHLTQMAMDRLQAQGSVYFDVLRDHLAGQPQDRNRLWIARKKLIALIRHEVALTCDSTREFEEEVAYLSRFLRPGTISEKKE